MGDASHSVSLFFGESLPGFESPLFPPERAPPGRRLPPASRMP